MAWTSALTDVTGQGARLAVSEMQGLPLARLSSTHTEAQQIALWKSLGSADRRLARLDARARRILEFETSLSIEFYILRPMVSWTRSVLSYPGVLSLVGNKGDDGFLRTDEVFNLRLGSPLVMLSACETGLGKEKRGEGVMGLTRAFLYAGAPTVGVSLWSVADKSTADLMTDFYKRLLSSPGAASMGGSPSAAMRDAQLANRVTLHLALGGGFDAAPAAAIRAPVPALAPHHRFPPVHSPDVVSVPTAGLDSRR